MSINYLDLSRTVSHALRHDPGAYGLVLDPQGWVTVDELLFALEAKSPEWRGLTEGDLREMILRSEKVRHAIEDGRVRALYGHSTPEKVEREACEPPEILFHGTDAEAAEKILVEGLQAMARQNVHLSADRETAWRVGLRKSKAPVILVVSALRAHADAVRFYRGDDAVWLADAIPAEFIRVETE